MLNDIKTEIEAEGIYIEYVVDDNYDLHSTWKTDINFTPIEAQRLADLFCDWMNDKDTEYEA